MSQAKAIQDELPIWLPRLVGNKGPRFLQIADALQIALAEGSLKPGDRLPPQRQLAAQLDVDLTTITRANIVVGAVSVSRVRVSDGTRRHR